MAASFDIRDLLMHFAHDIAVTIGEAGARDSSDGLLIAGADPTIDPGLPRFVMAVAWGADAARLEDRIKDFKPSDPGYNAVASVNGKIVLPGDSN